VNAAAAIARMTARLMSILWPPPSRPIGQISKEKWAFPEL